MNKKKLLKDYFDNIQEPKIRQVTLGILEIQKESEISNAEKLRRMKKVIENMCGDED